MNFNFPIMAIVSLLAAGCDFTTAESRRIRSDADLPLDADHIGSDADADVDHDADFDETGPIDAGDSDIEADGDADIDADIETDADDDTFIIDPNDYTPTLHEPELRAPNGFFSWHVAEDSGADLENIVGYRFCSTTTVIEAIDEEAECPIAETPTETFIALSDLTPGTNLYWKVQALLIDGANSPFSAVQTSEIEDVTAFRYNFDGTIDPTVEPAIAPYFGSEYIGGTPDYITSGITCIDGGTPVDNIIGSAICLNGVDTAIRLFENHPETDPDPSDDPSFHSANFGIEARIHLTSNGVIVDRSDELEDWPPPGFYLAVLSGKLNWMNNGDWVFFGSEPAVPFDQIVHIYLVHRDRKQRIYINDNPPIEVSYPGSILDSGLDITLGANWNSRDGYSNFLEASLDFIEFRHEQDSIDPALELARWQNARCAVQALAGETVPASCFTE